MGKFEKFKGAKCKIDIDGEAIELETTEEDRLRILAAQEMSGVEKYKEIFQAVVDLVLRHYPNEPEDEVRAMVKANFEKIFMAIGVHFGWIEENRQDFLRKRRG